MKRFFGKKQVMLATLAVALGMAVYLNYYFAQHDPGPDKSAGGTPAASTTTSTTGGHLGDSQYVSASTTPQEETTPTEAEGKEGERP